jgi:hypothetical protein
LSLDVLIGLRKQGKKEIRPGSKFHHLALRNGAIRLFRGHRYNHSKLVTVTISSSKKQQSGLFVTRARAPSSLGPPILPEPFDEQPRAVLDGRIWSKPNGAFQTRTIGASPQNIARLHRQEFSNGRTTDGMLDQLNKFDHLNGAAVADVVEPPWRMTGRWIRRIARPRGIWLRRLFDEADDGRRDVVNIGEVAP